MQPDPATEHHRWLMQLVGEWAYEGRAAVEPGQPEMTWGGREVVRAFGELWTLGEMIGDIPGGGRMSALISMGYDPRVGRYRGTFLASTSSHLWLYDGARAGQVLTLDCEGPSFADPGKLVAYQDIVEFIGPDERRLASRVRGDDGSWTEFMTSVFRRVG